MRPALLSDYSPTIPPKQIILREVSYLLGRRLAPKILLFRVGPYYSKGPTMAKGRAPEFEFIKRRNVT